MTEIVMVQDLRPGDFCIGSKTRIISPPVKRVRTPPRYCELGVQRSDGKVETVTWRTGTTIRVQREEKESDE